MAVGHSGGHSEGNSGGNSGSDNGSTGAASSGKVVFIGAGPGAADLITLRGAQRLAQADVVLFDALTDPALRSLAPRALWVDVGKRGFADSTGQATIDALLVRHARQVGAHGRVVRLKGGDPSIFGRLEEELQALAAAGITCEVVPGVTAALAAAADTQRPLTRRAGKAGQHGERGGRSVSLTTAMTQQRSLHAGPRAEHADTEVFYMAGRQLGALGRRLQQAGWPLDTPVNVVSRAGWPDMLASDHTLAALGAAAVLHADRPTVVTAGVGAAPVAGTDAASRGHAEHGAGHRASAEALASPATPLALVLAGASALAP